MGKKVVIVESPSKSKTLSKYLGKDFKIVASMGHIIDLPKKELAVDIDNDFKPKFVVIPGKSKTIKLLKDALKNAEQVFLASDPDREGEAIAFHIARHFKILKTAKRVLFNEITKKAVLDGVANSTEIDIDKVSAQIARRLLDRLVGYKVSPLLWKLLHKGLSAGRVQSVALKILAKRDDEIEKFVPKEFWILDLILDALAKKFPAKITKFQGKKLEIANQKEAKKHTDAVKKNAPFTVDKIDVKKLRKNPPPPFITSSLQLEVSRKLGFSAKRTMRIAQQLYEGVELGEKGPVGLITYMRTDSVRIANVARADAKKFISTQFGKEYIGNIVYKTKKSAQDAHEAIRPTFAQNTPEQIKSYLTKEQYRIYELIWLRFIASQMASAKLERTKLELKAGDYIVDISATKVLFDGFLKIWKVPITENKEEADVKFPSLKIGDTVKLSQIKPSQHFTKPPARYSEGTLVKELETQGIGRPSTYAQIISTLLDRKYVNLDKKRLYVTELGKEVNNLLQKMFPKIFEEKFTAKMEEELDEVEQGDKKWQQVLDEFYTPFAKKLTEIEKNRKEIKKGLVKEIDRNCPECGSPLIIRWGRYGKFIACSNFPKCKYTEPLDKDEKKRKSEVVKLDEKCPQCGSQLVIKYNHRGGKFIACSNYPKCKYLRSYSTGIACPRENCNGNLLELTSKKGKIFYACDNKDCDFVAFNEPVAEPCPECGAKTTFVKKLKSGDVHYCEICKWRQA
ncbi:type I DNA topoisomerase [bacterium]|nr:type I DNA topoisomerase [bacterium]